MKVYVLVAKDEEGEISFNMPYDFGRKIRAYTSKARAKSYARRFNCDVVELDIDSGKIL